ncbi:MAG TPA: hypothetical protein VMT74_10240 [Gaiellaceae bacterium]|nr:hypothetical protein [Gaiellaceae bacterium]
MRRPLLVAAVLALAAAAPAAATLPLLPSGTSVGDGVPLKAYATLTPQVHLFGDPVTASIAVVADTKWVDPRRLRVTASFKPYAPVKAPTVLRLGTGRFEQITWTWTLRCLSSACVPRYPPSDTAHVFRFPLAHIDYLDTHGRVAYGITTSWPHVEAISQLSPSSLATLGRRLGLPWKDHFTPLAAPTYSLRPGLLFWLSLSLAALLGCAALLLAARWVLAIRPRRVPEPVLSSSASPLERALVLLAWAHEHHDETLQRKALERVADELGTEVAGIDELTVKARELAWSSRGPESEEFDSFSEQAREQGHVGSPPAEEGA